MCLQLRCLAIDVLLFRTFAYAGMCLAIRCLAMGMLVHQLAVRLRVFLVQLTIYQLIKRLSVSY
jgi:hypothetical protein